MRDVLFFQFVQMECAMCFQLDFHRIWLIQGALARSCAFYSGSRVVCVLSSNPHVNLLPLVPDLLNFKFRRIANRE